MYGIDVSGWQADINLSRVPADFVIIKVTGGTGFQSGWPSAPGRLAHPGQFDQVRRLGRQRGVYHFAREQGYEGSAETEAEHFVQVCLQHGYFDGQTVPVLDWEGDNVRDSHWAALWLHNVWQASGVRPLIYMNLDAVRGADWSRVAPYYPLWLAAPMVPHPRGYTPVQAQQVPYWGKPVMTQFSFHGRLPGYAGDLDLNRFHGDFNTWRTLLGQRRLSADEQFWADCGLPS